MEEAEKKRAANKSLNTTIKTPESKTVQNLSELDDEYLREGLLVLSDLINSKIG